jgi:hypothetical protein
VCVYIYIYISLITSHVGVTAGYASATELIVSGNRPTFIFILILAIEVKFFFNSGNRINCMWRMVRELFVCLMTKEREDMWKRGGGSMSRCVYYRVVDRFPSMLARPSGKGMLVRR